MTVIWSPTDPRDSKSMRFSLTYVRDLSGPIQWHHGTADRSVPLEYSLSLEQQIVAAGKPVDLYTYAGDGHNIAKSFGLAMKRSVASMDKYVKGG